MFEIKNTLLEKDIEEQFVAIGSRVGDDGNAYHSLIIIKYLGKIYQFHYYGELLFDTDIRENCFHKVTYAVNGVLVPAFIAMCLNVQAIATPEYGYFYSGEFYDFDGKHFSPEDIGQKMTCAGFCINVLKGFLEEDYISYTEWDSSSHPFENYVKDYAVENGIEVGDIEKSHRRISPVELICSAYFKDLPIKRSQIESKLPEVQEYFELY